MEHAPLVTWYAREYEYRPKERDWYWIVGIVAIGAAVAAGIMNDYLLSLIAVIGGFTLMIVGAKKPSRHKYSLTESGFHIGTHLIPYSDITRFSIHDDEDPKRLSLETKTWAGTVSAPLGDADWRRIRTELKNRNIEETEGLDSFIDAVGKRMGL